MEVESLEQIAHGCRPLFWFLGQTGEDGLAPVCGDRIAEMLQFLPALFQGRSFPGFDLLADIAALERRFARQQLVDQGTEGVDVVLSGGAVSPELLGAHVGQRAGHKLVL